ncbi:MAG TPA: trehalose-phosphatase [Methylocella sp.]|nr:trehalose-phosphatase [Methylocella sp.]
MEDAPLALSPCGLAELAPPASSAYFLDVDGTLLEIKPRPEDVMASGDVLALLRGLESAAGGALGLVSGRRIDDLDRIFFPLVFPAAGLHGAELRFANGQRVSCDGAALAIVRPAIVDYTKRHPKLRLEDKGASLAVHYRQAPELEIAVLAFLAERATENGLSVQPGKMVAELKEARHDKGRGIAALYESPPFHGRKPLFIGDDLTDENGFDFVNACGGISVRVGELKTTRARFSFSSPSDVRAALYHLLDG